MNEVAAMNNYTLPVYFQTIMYVMNQSMNASNEPESYNYYLLNLGQEINHTRCYGIYGCFSLAPPWTSADRPISFYPEWFNKLKPIFYLFTRSNPNEPAIIDLNEEEIIESVGLDPDLKLYLITHGWMNDGKMPWIKDMRNELLAYENCSVIVVDWGTGSGPHYTQAVANTRLVGAMTAHLLSTVAEASKDKKLDHIHAIGHSLGAHMFGYASYTLQKDFNLTLGRITGLDPAEPHFLNSKRPVRLDKSAAHYVDIVHTDATSFIRFGAGMKDKIGHIDFFPNGGNNQPGCDQGFQHFVSTANGSLLGGIKKSLACNHVRAHQYFIESIRTSCPFMSIECSSYEDFQKGKCMDCTKYGHNCVQFGMHSKASYNNLLAAGKISKDNPITTYLMTGSGKPYCRAHYRIAVTVSDDQVSKQHGGEIGQLWITVYGEENGKGVNSGKMTLHSGGYYAPGEHYMALVPAHAVPAMKSVLVEWENQSSMFNPLTWRLLQTPKIYVRSITIDAMEIGESVTVCPPNKAALTSKKPQFLYPRYCT